MSAANQPLNRLALVRRVVPSLVFNVLLPTIAFAVLPPHVGGVTNAILIGAAIPTAYTLAQLAFRRRLDPLGVIVIAAFAIELAIFFAVGQDPFVLKLQEAILTGPLGVVLLLSVAVHHPLLVVVVTRLSRNRAADTAATPASGTAPGKLLALLTLIAGLTLTAHALVITGMAIVLSTDTFLHVGRVIGFAVIAAGVVAGLLALRRSRALPPRS